MSCERENVCCGCMGHKKKEEEKSKVPRGITARDAIEYMLTHGDDFKFQREQPKVDDMARLVLLTVMFTMSAVLIYCFAEDNIGRAFGGGAFLLAVGICLGMFVQLIKTYYSNYCNAMKAMIELCKEKHIEKQQTAAAPATIKATATADAVVHCLCKPPRVAKEVTVEKCGPNSGRSFYSCPLTTTENRCRFFKWKSNGGGGGGGDDIGGTSESAPKCPAATVDADADVGLDGLDYDGCSSPQVEILPNKPTGPVGTRGPVESVSACTRCRLYE